MEGFVERGAFQPSRRRRHFLMLARLPFGFHFGSILETLAAFLEPFCPLGGILAGAKNEVEKRRARGKGSTGGDPGASIKMSWLVPPRVSTRRQKPFEISFKRGLGARVFERLNFPNPVFLHFASETTYMPKELRGVN